MKFKKPTFHPLPAIIGLSVATLIALGLSHWTTLPFWGAFVIVVGSMFINSVIAEKEDDAPGGFNNPLPPAKKESDPVASANSGAAHRSGTS